MGKIKRATGKATDGYERLKKAGKVIRISSEKAKNNIMKNWPEIISVGKTSLPGMSRFPSPSACPSKPWRSRVAFLRPFALSPFRLLPLLVAFLSLPSPSLALFDDLGMGARAPGMGNAFTAVADDLHAMHYNPAGLASLERSQMSASHSLLNTGLSDGSSLGLSHVAFARPLHLGKWGVIGGAWQQFSLSGVYSEQTLQMSYGNNLLPGKFENRLKWGLSIKRLSHSFSQLDEAFNSMDRLTVMPGVEDPVLTKKTGQSAFDADVGLLYRFSSRYSLGLAIKDVLQPNMAFGDGDTDKIPMRTRLGFAHKSLWMVLSSELRMEKSPAGTTDRDFIVAAERIFPSLDSGQFGIRGSLGMGSRDFRQVTAGLSYRINKIQFDYAFLLPLGTIKGTSGTHRLAMVFHFGAPTAEEQYSMELLDQYKRIASKEEFDDIKHPASLNDPKFRDIVEKLNAGRYREAARLLSEMAGEMPLDSSVIRLSKRISAVAAFYPELHEPEYKWETVLSSGITNFLWGNDEKAVKQISYAQSLNQEDAKLDTFLTRIANSTGLRPDKVPQDYGKDLVEYKFYESESAFNRNEQELAIKKLTEIMDLEQEDQLAVKRIGSSYYVMGEYKKALQAWEKAVGKETDPEEKELLVKFMDGAKQMISSPAGTKPAVAGNIVLPAAKPLEAAKKRPVDFREIEKLYQKGVEFYAQGASMKAASIFRRILMQDPGNAQAAKALERIGKMSPK